MPNEQHDSDVGDVAQPGIWFCIRCETEQPAKRRLNAVGGTALGALFPVIGTLYSSLEPAVARHTYTEGEALAIVGVIGALLALLVIGILKEPGRTLICSECEHTEIVPASSRRAQRVKLAANAEIAKLRPRPKDQTASP